MCPNYYVNTYAYWDFSYSEFEYLGNLKEIYNPFVIVLFQYHDERDLFIGIFMTLL